MTYSALQSWERRLLALYDCQCVMATPSIRDFRFLVDAQLSTFDTVEYRCAMMNIYHITPHGEFTARQIKRRLL